MFSSKLTFCCIVALHFTSSGASPVQQTSALQYADTESGARALYITLSSSQGVVGSQVTGGVLYITMDGSSSANTVTISDRPTQGASFVAPNGRLDITITGSSSQTQLYYDGTPNQPAIDFLSIKIIGSSSRNNINFSGSSVTASGTLRVSIDGSSSVNYLIINDPSLRPADNRLQISITGTSSQNTVIVNGSPRQTF